MQWKVQPLGGGGLLGGTGRSWPSGMWWCPRPGALEVRWRGGGWLGLPWLITNYFSHDVLNIRVVDQAHLFTSWKVPGDPLLQASGFINEDTG